MVELFVWFFYSLILSLLFFNLCNLIWHSGKFPQLNFLTHLLNCFMSFLVLIYKSTFLFTKCSFFISFYLFLFQRGNNASFYFSEDNLGFFFFFWSFILLTELYPCPLSYYFSLFAVGHLSCYSLFLNILNSFIEIQFIYRTIHSLKVYNCMALVYWQSLHPSPQSIFELFHYSKKKPHTL